MSNEFWRRIKKWYYSQGSRQRYTKRQEILFEQYYHETNRTALNKNNEITHAFKMWEHEQENKQENKQEKLKQKFLDDPSIEKLEELGFTEVTEKELDNQILKETLEDVDMIFIAMTNWIKKRYGLKSYKKFLNFLKRKLKECKHLKIEIK